MIDSIKLTRFKQFKETEIQLRPFSILMGENNSGKTSVLQAIWLALTSLHQGKLLAVDWKTMQTKVSGTGCHMYDIPFAPQGDFSGMFYKRISREGQTYDENSGAIIQVVDANQNCFRLHLRELFRTLNVKLLTPAKELQNPQVHKYAPLYISGYTGLHLQEERLFPAMMEAKIAAGNAAAIVRNIILDLKLQAPEKYQYLEKLLEEEFGFHIKEVRFREDDERYVFSAYEEPGRKEPASLEFGSAGSGILQIMQTVAVILRYCPEKTRVVLIDEPEAHLNGSLQVKFAEILMRMQEELGIQIILATHSAEIIENADPEDVIPILSDMPVNRGLICRTAVQRKAFESLGVYTIARAKLSGKLAFFEMDSLEIMEKMADVLRKDCFLGLPSIPVVRGWKKHDSLPFALYSVLKEVLGRSIEIFVVLCPNNTSEDWKFQLLQAAKDGKVKLQMLTQTDGGSYLLKAPLLLRALEKNSVNAGKLLPTEEIIRQEILEALDSCQEMEEAGMKHHQPLDFVLLWLNEEYGLQITKKNILRSLQEEDIPKEIRELLENLTAEKEEEQTEESQPVFAGRKKEFEQLTFLDL